MRQVNYKKVNHRVKSTLQALPSMGIAFLVLGILILTASFVFSTKSNLLLFAGLFFILAGGAGYVYSLKKG